MRYELRVIRDSYNANGRNIQPLDAPLFETDDAAEMKARANVEGSAHYYGIAIVDNQAGTVDWGDEVTPLRGQVQLGVEHIADGGGWKGYIELL